MPLADVIIDAFSILEIYVTIPRRAMKTKVDITHVSPHSAAGEPFVAYHAHKATITSLNLVQHQVIHSKGV